jgi:ribosomal protein L37AE/L43A
MRKYIYFNLCGDFLFFLCPLFHTMFCVCFLWSFLLCEEINLMSLKIYWFYLLQFFFFLVWKHHRSKHDNIQSIQSKASHTIHNSHQYLMWIPFRIPFGITDSIRYGHKHYNQKRIKQIKFNFNHHQSCAFKKSENQHHRSQPSLYRNWDCKKCGLWVLNEVNMFNIMKFLCSLGSIRRYLTSVWYAVKQVNLLPFTKKVF